MNDSQDIKNCSFNQTDKIVSDLQMVIYIPTIIFGSIFNILALVIFHCFLKKWTETTIYMTNLAFADILLLFSLPFKLHFTAKSTSWSKYTCSFLQSLYYISMYMSIYIIMCISLDRYIAIKYPFKAKAVRSPRQSLLVCFGFWVFVWLCSIPVYKFHDSSSGDYKCFHNISEDSWSTAFIISVEIFGFLIPLTVVTFCSIQIIRTLSERCTSERKKAITDSCIRIIYANLIVFVISFAPSHLGIFLQFLVRQKIIQNCTVKQSISFFIQVAMCLSNVNCCLDAICYYFAAKEFQQITFKAKDFRLTVSVAPSSVD
ncbi:G-protein coupled receptor 55-like [Protopterus annectens]|uniref:G-protein coupled receptor 55-like n=1 Tax=Protopterus annectens TaxID=7888 RepID=UPI001CF9C464|nr:G-protein coupled receptor 55-like [Protopterus annectens]XP_043926300.1 G-protein coupled receptor 55-like [Protopterus annectens]